MADQSNPPPGSRAIKIPISRLKNNSQATARRRALRDTNMLRTDSTEGSSSDFSTSMLSASSSTTREAAFPLRKTMASPPGRAQASLSTPQSNQRKDKQRASELPPPNSVPTRVTHSSHTHFSPLSPSMLSSSSYKSINLNSHMSPDQPPRLITYTKHSQGFTWNDELFLPSYLVGRRYRGSRNRRRWGQPEDEDDEMEEDDVPFDEEADRCPVHDIFVTDEEAAAMLP